MSLQKIRLSEALKKFKLKRPTMGKRPMFEFRPLSPKSILSSHCDDDGDDYSDVESVGRSGSPNSIPADVEKGFLAVYVGRDDDELQRYVIPVNYLKHGIFKTLLRSAEEEFGFSHSGGIRIPCETVLFEHLLWLLNKNDPTVHSLEMEELLRFYCS